MTTKLKITLSNRAPVTIVEDMWPVIAETDWHDGEVASQANRRRTIRVLQHMDGRAIVYGWCRSSCRDEASTQAGILIPAPITTTGYDVVINAIRRVAEDIGDPRLADDCIADLPPEDI